MLHHSIQTEILPEVTDRGLFFLRTDGGEQIAQLLFNLGRIGDGLGNFLFQYLSVPSSEPMYGHFYRPFGHIQLFGHSAVGPAILARR